MTLLNEVRNLICDDDTPNACPDDGARTDLIHQYSTHTLEECPCCNKQFNFWSE